jgi:hypothetical protein
MSPHHDGRHIVKENAADRDLFYKCFPNDDRLRDGVCDVAMRYHDRYNINYWVTG